MNEASLPQGGPEAGGAARTEPAAMSPFSRFLNVFFSPGAVFADIRRDPRGWWVPLAAAAVLFAVFGTIYVSRYDMGVVIKEQLKDHWSMKMVAGLQGPEARDKALAIAVAKVAATPVWQLACSQWINFVTGFTLAAWFFTFLYGLIALVMGWIPEARSSKLWISLGVVVGTGVIFLVIGGALQVAQGMAAKRAGGGDPAAAAAVPPSTWIVATGIVLALATCSVILWSLFRLASDISFGRILGAVSYGLAPAALSAIVGVVVVFLRTPDATPFEDLVPSNLSLILNLKESGAAIAALGSAIGFFSIWSIVLTIVGLARTLGRSSGEAAAAVLTPSILWILFKTVFAALLG